jgi:hypothetical protein
MNYYLYYPAKRWSFFPLGEYECELAFNSVIDSVELTFKGNRLACKFHNHKGKERDLLNVSHLFCFPYEETESYFTCWIHCH